MESPKFPSLSILKNEELFFSIFCMGIAVSHIFWTLLNSILCLLFFAYWLFFAKKELSWKNSKSRWIVLFCLFYIIVLTGFFYSSNTETALFKLQQKSALLLFPIVFGTSVTLSEKLLHLTLKAFTLSVILGCFVCFGYGIYNYVITGSAEHLYGYNLNILKDMTPFTFGLCCLLSILYLLHNTYLDKSSNKNQRVSRSAIFKLVAAFGLLAFLLILGNRIILVIAFVIFIIYSFQFLSKVGYKIFTAATIIAIFAVAINLNPSLHKQWKELIDFSEQNSIQLDKDLSLGRSWGGKQLRSAIWKCSWDVIKAHPFWGVGTGDGQDSLQAAYENRKFYFASRYNRYNAHNQYLQEAVNFGLIGEIVFLCSLFLPVLVNFKKQEKLFYCLFLLGFSFACVTDTPLDLNKGIILYSFFNSFIFFSYYNLNFRPTNGTAKQKR